MASLTGSTIAASYEQLLSLPDGGLNGNTLVAVTDGDSSTAIGMKVATSKIEIIPASDDANAFEVSNAAGTAILTINSSTTSASLVHTVTTATSTPKALFIDANTSGVAAQDSVGLHVDFDRTVAGSGTAAHNDIGINLDVNSASLGTSSVIGMDIDVVGATGGTHTATGLDVTVGSSDTNYAASFGDTGNEVLVRLASNSNNARGFIYANNNNQIGFKDSDGDSVYQTGDNESHIWSTQGSETMRLTAGGELTLAFAKQLRWNTHGGNANSRSWGMGAGVVGGSGNADYFGISSSNADDNTLDTSVLVIDKDGKIGIGENAPLATLHVKEGDSGLSSLNSSGTNVFLEANGSNAAGMTIASGNTANGYIIFGDSDSNFQGAIQYDHSSSEMTLVTSAADALRISSAGEVTKPLQPAFCVPAVADTDMTVGGAQAVVFGTERFDLGGDFASNTFVAPITGKYQFNIWLKFDQLTTNSNYIDVRLITSNKTHSFMYSQQSTVGVHDMVGGSVLADMDASDTVTVAVYIDAGGATIDLIADGSFLSGYLAC